MGGLNNIGITLVGILFKYFIGGFQIAAVKDFLKKRGDERYGELHKGLILSETFAQLEENDLIK